MSDRNRRFVSRYGNQASPNKRKTLLLLATAALFVLGLLFLIFFTDLFGSSDPFVSTGLSPSVDIKAANEKTVFYLKGSTLYKTDRNGKVIWSFKFSSGQVDMEVGESIVCIYNEESAALLDSDKTPLFNIPSSDFIISDVICGKKSVALLCTIEEDPTTYLRVFDTSGTELDRIEISDASILKFGFYGDNDALWYLTLDTTGAVPISRVHTALPSQQLMTGLYEVYGQLVSDVCFLGSDIYITNATALTSYDTFGEEISEWLIYGSKLADFVETKNDLILAYIPTPVVGSNDAIYTVRILSKGGKDTLIQLPAGIEHFALSENYIYCFGDNNIYLYTHSGEFYKSITPEFTITSFEKLCDDLVLLGGGQESYLFALD